MSSPRRYTERISGLQDGALTLVDRILDRRPRAFFAILSKLIFVSNQPIPFVNEEDFRSPLLLLPVLRHRPVRFGVDLDCNPPLNAEVPAWLYFLLSKILSA